MRIALVLDDSLDTTDGVQQYVLTLGAWLRNEGHQVTFIASTTSRSDTEVMSLARNVAVRFNGNAMKTPLPTSRRAIRNALEQIEVDVIHIQMPYSPLFGGRVVDTAGLETAVVGTFHVMPTGAVSRLANQALAAWSRRSLARVDRIMAVSEPAAKFAHDAYGISCEVVGNVVDTARFEKARIAHRSKVITVSFLGRLVPRKGVLDLIAAYNRLPDEAAKTSRLVIGGAGSLKARATALARTDRDISFRGYIPERDKPAFLASADICVLPSTGGESFGIVLVEAIAAGAAVLAANNPGYSSVLGPGSQGLVKAGDVAALSRHLAELIGDANRRQVLRDREATAALQYDVRKVGPKIVSCYEEALRARKHSRSVVSGRGVGTRA